MDQISEAEKARYQAIYCGLCKELKTRYGQASRLALNHDLTFAAMLMSSLAEGPEETSSGKCILNPGKRMEFTRLSSTPYCADLTVALAYHKCLDDVNDEGKLRARAAKAALDGAYEKAQARIPEQCASVQQSMEAITLIESDPTSGMDAAANEFGRLLGHLFEHDSGFFEEHMRAFGDALGRLVYMMDAAVDLEDDKQTGSYNPLAMSSMSVDDMRCMLSALAYEAACTFEKLPLERDAHIMQSILYSGIWQKFNHVYSDA